MSGLIIDFFPQTDHLNGKYVRLGLVSRIFSGGTPDKGNLDYWEGGDIPWIGSGEVNQGVVRNPTTHITRQAVEKSATKLFPKDSLIMALAGQGRTKGTVARMGMDAYGNQSLGCISDYRGESRFLYWWLSSLYREIRNLSSQETRDGLNQSMLGQIPVPLFDISTQRQIADFLDRETARIDLLIEKKQRLVALLGEKIRAAAFRAVTQGIATGVPMKPCNLMHQKTLPSHWQQVALGKKITLQRGVDITKDEQNQDGQYPVISSGGVSSYHDRFTCRGPGVLIGRKGSAGRLHYSERDFWAHDTTLYVKNFFGNDPKFVFHKLATIDLESFDRSSANPTINRNFVHPVRVSWAPNLGEQKEIVSSIERLKTQIAPIEAATNASIDRLKEYRSALITAAVTGQIDVQTYAKSGTPDRSLDAIQEEMGA